MDIKIAAMPISRNQFNEGRTSESLAGRLATFLHNNSANAYTIDELLFAVANETEKTSMNDPVDRTALNIEFLMTLNGLERDGIVESRMIATKNGQTQYYLIKTRNH